jgi:hypothetical protein
VAVCTPSLFFREENVLGGVLACDLRVWKCYRRGDLDSYACATVRVFVLWLTCCHFWHLSLC